MAREGSFAGTGIQAEGSLQIKNGASVEATGDDTGVNGNAGIYISDSTVNAYATETEGYQALFLIIVSPSPLIITLALRRNMETQPSRPERKSPYQAAAK